MGKINFDDLRKANEDRCIEWMGAPPNLKDISFHACELGGEVGEALNICKKIDRYRMNIPGKIPPLQGRPMLAEELADVIICVDMIASILDIDLAESVRRKFNATSEKHGFNIKLALRAERNK